jgi:D-hexose-6-phosphate mutarotase
MSFTAALHTYFAVSSIGAVTVEGLSGVTYLDSLAGGAKVAQEGPVVFDREVDRIYLTAPDAAMKVRAQKAVHVLCSYCAAMLQHGRSVVGTAT